MKVVRHWAHTRPSASAWLAGIFVAEVVQIILAARGR